MLLMYIPTYPPPLCMTLDAWVSLQRRGMQLDSYNKKTGIEPVEMHIFDWYTGQLHSSDTLAHLPPSVTYLSCFNSRNDWGRQVLTPSWCEGGYPRSPWWWTCNSPGGVSWVFQELVFSECIVFAQIFSLFFDASLNSVSNDRSNSKCIFLIDVLALKYSFFAGICAAGALLRSPYPSWRWWYGNLRSISVTIPL